MKERPILFNGPMVRAILEGRKTQTRRLAPAPNFKYPSNYERGMVYHHSASYGWIGTSGFGMACEQWTFGRCPYGQPGDRLWVRESAWFWYEKGKKSSVMGYRADLDPHLLACPDDYQIDDPWFLEEPCVPSIHMPRWASRITLEVTGVRVERLQEISEEDAKAEGVRSEVPVHGEPPTYYDYALNTEDSCEWFGSPKLSFQSLWDSLAKPGTTWADNPWVWVIEFKAVGA